MATKAGLFNAALIEIGHQTMVDTGEAVVVGRDLNSIYSQAMTECLAAASWNFAMETIQADADTGVTPSFGFTEVFAKPTDWLRTIVVSADEYFSYPLLQFYDDVNYWSADVTPIYIRYVSNDTGLGFELTRWPASFTRYAAMELAARIAPKYAKSETERVYAMRDRAKITAISHDALNEAQPRFPPMGRWNRSRAGGGRGDRTGNSLIG
jgi:hypothetical protein